MAFQAEAQKILFDVFISLLQSSLKFEELRYNPKGCELNIHYFFPVLLFVSQDLIIGKFLVFDIGPLMS